MPDLSTTPTSVENNAIPIYWTISRHVFQCLACMAWVSAGVRIARVNRRWVCTSCGEAAEQIEEKCSCGGTGWVDDQNWSPEHEGERARGRVKGAGLIPCGLCNEGGWVES